MMAKLMFERTVMLGICTGSPVYIKLTLVLLNKLRCHAHSNFQPIRLLDLGCCYKFTYLMANSVDPDQLASSEAS